MSGITRPATGGFIAFLVLGLFLIDSIWFQPPSAQAEVSIYPPNPKPVLVQPVEFDNSSEAERALSEMVKLLKDNQTPAKAKEMVEKQIAEFRKQDDKSKAEVQVFLRDMVGAKNYCRRLTAVRFLVREQDMDNAPSLIYALSDPDFRIAFEAHQGLRLLSRKIDSIKLTDTTIENAQRDCSRLSPQIVASMRSEFKTMEDRWSVWFLGIRPEAQLFKQDQPSLGEEVHE